MDKIIDVQSERKARYGQIHKQYLVQWKEYSDPIWIDEADQIVELYCRSSIAIR